MKIILKNERMMEGEDKRYLLKYELISSVLPEDEGEGRCYGIIVEQYIWSAVKEDWMLEDESKVKGFSESLEETTLFFQKVVEGVMMPVSLEDIVDDWKSAFSPDYRASA